MMVGGYNVIGQEEEDAHQWVQAGRMEGRREDGPVAGILTGELGGY